MSRKITIFIILAVAVITVIVLGFTAIKNQYTKGEPKITNSVGKNQPVDEKRQKVIDRLKSIGY